MNNDFPIDELKKQLEEAKREDQELKQFGAKTHKYSVNPTIALETIEQFENKIGVSLPEEYRDFLLYVGNGGAGPFYGMFCLEQVEHWLQWELEPDRPPLLCPEQSNESLDQEEDNWRRGCIPIGSQGDTYFTGLMLTGENRGHIVYIEYEGSWIFFPKESNFLCWYQRWLKEVCNHYHSFWFATNLDGNEQELREYYKQAETEDEKLYAIESMNKFPNFSQDTVDFIEQVMWERRDMEDARGFLSLIYRANPEFFNRFLESRWQMGRYDAVIQELYSSLLHIKEEKHIPEIWWSRILDKLPEISPDRRRENAIYILEKSRAVSLNQLIWVLNEEQDSSVK